MATQYFAVENPLTLVYFGNLFNAWPMSNYGGIEDGILPAEWTLPIVTAGVIRARRVTPIAQMYHANPMDRGPAVYCTATGLQMSTQYAIWVNGLPYMPGCEPDPDKDDSNPDRSL